MKNSNLLPKKLPQKQKLNSDLRKKTNVPRDQINGGFSVDTFRSEINTSSILQTCRHLQMFTIPKGLMNNFDSGDAKKVILRCDATSLPGISFATSGEIRRFGVGPSERKPYLPIFGPVSCSYIADGSGVIHSFFYEWMSYIVGFDSSRGMNAINSYGHMPYELSYKDDYISEVTILVHNENDDKIIELTLYGAYPINLESIPLSWSSTNEFMRINVAWEYIDWSARYYSASSNGPASSTMDLIIRNINKTLGSVGRVSNLASSLGFTSVATNLNSLVGRAGIASQRYTNLISGAKNTIEKNTIVSSLKKRLGF